MKALLRWGISAALFAAIGTVSHSYTWVSPALKRPLGVAPDMHNSPVYYFPMPDHCRITGPYWYLRPPFPPGGNFLPGPIGHAIMSGYLPHELLLDKQAMTLGDMPLLKGKKHSHSGGDNHLGKLLGNHSAPPIATNAPPGYGPPPIKGGHHMHGHGHGHPGMHGPGPGYPPMHGPPPMHGHGQPYMPHGYGLPQGGGGVPGPYPMVQGPMPGAPMQMPLNGYGGAPGSNPYMGMSSTYPLAYGPAGAGGGQMPAYGGPAGMLPTPGPMMMPPTPPQPIGRTSYYPTVEHNANVGIWQVQYAPPYMGPMAGPGYPRMNPGMAPMMPPGYAPFHPGMAPLRAPGYPPFHPGMAPIMMPGYAPRYPGMVPMMPPGYAPQYGMSPFMAPRPYYGVPYGFGRPGMAGFGGGPGFPSMPGFAAGPGFAGAPSMSGSAGMPSSPSMSGLPSMPSSPSMPGSPSMPSSPSMSGSPSMPGMRSLAPIPTYARMGIQPPPGTFPYFGPVGPFGQYGSMQRPELPYPPSATMVQSTPITHAGGNVFPTHPFTRSPRDFFMWGEMMEDERGRGNRTFPVPN